MNSKTVHIIKTETKKKRGKPKTKNENKDNNVKLTDIHLIQQFYSLIIGATEHPQKLFNQINNGGSISVKSSSLNSLPLCLKSFA